MFGFQRIVCVLVGLFGGGLLYGLVVGGLHFGIECLKSGGNLVHSVHMVGFLSDYGIAVVAPVGLHAVKTGLEISIFGFILSLDFIQAGIESGLASGDCTGHLIIACVKTVDGRLRRIGVVLVASPHGIERL